MVHYLPSASHLRRCPGRSQLRLGLELARSFFEQRKRIDSRSHFEPMPLPDGFSSGRLRVQRSAHGQTLVQREGLRASGSRLNFFCISEISAADLEAFEDEVRENLKL